MLSVSESAASDRASLLASLAVAVGTKQIVSGDSLGRYNNDWTGDHRGLALAVVRARGIDDVAATIRWCAAHGIPLVPQGGHTGLVAGGTPTASGNEVVLSLELMNKVREIDPVNGVAIVEAGCVLADLKEAVDSAGAYFPLSIGSQGSCQIGGAISTNAGGINVVRYGMTRALVMGLEVVLPDGQVYRDLRGLHKNNTGYDLKQMFIGAEGTLGVVTAAAVKIVPKPTQVETLFLATSSTPAVIELFRRIRTDSGDLISGFELMGAPSIELVCATEPNIRNPLSAIYPAYAIVELSASGGPPIKPWLDAYLATLMEEGLVLDGVIAQNQTQVAEIWALREGIVESQARFGAYLRTDISTAISAVARFIERGTEAVEALVPGARCLPYGHVGDGNLHFNVIRPVNMTPEEFAPLIHKIEDELFTIVDEFGGSISAEHGIGLAKRHAFEARLEDVPRRLMRALKQTLDPRNIMNPGRILS